MNSIKTSKGHITNSNPCIFPTDAIGGDDMSYVGTKLQPFGFFINSLLQSQGYGNNFRT